MNLFWKKPKPKAKANTTGHAAARALDSLDAALPGSATDDDFILAVSAIAAHWCITNMEGQTLSREVSLRRAEKLYHAVNAKIYDGTRPDQGVIVLGG